MANATVSKLVEAYLLHYTYDKTLAKLRQSDRAVQATRGAPGVTCESEVSGEACERKGARAASGQPGREDKDGAAVDGDGRHGPPAAVGVEYGDEGDTDTAAGGKMLETLDLRRALRAHVLCGDVEGAIALCEARCEGLLMRHREAHFLLLCQGGPLLGRRYMAGVTWPASRGCYTPCRSSATPGRIPPLLSCPCCAPDFGLSRARALTRAPILNVDLTLNADPRPPTRTPGLTLSRSSCARFRRSHPQTGAAQGGRVRPGAPDGFPGRGSPR